MMQFIRNILIKITAAFLLFNFTNKQNESFFNNKISIEEQGIYKLGAIINPEDGHLILINGDYNNFINIYSIETNKIISQFSVRKGRGPGEMLDVKTASFLVSLVNEKLYIWNDYENSLTVFTYTNNEIKFLEKKLIDFNSNIGRVGFFRALDENNFVASFYPSKSNIRLATFGIDDDKIKINNVLAMYDEFSPSIYDEVYTLNYTSIAVNKKLNKIATSSRYFSDDLSFYNFKGEVVEHFQFSKPKSDLRKKYPRLLMFNDKLIEYRYMPNSTSNVLCALYHGVIEVDIDIEKKMKQTVEVFDWNGKIVFKEQFEDYPISDFTYDNSTGQIFALQPRDRGTLFVKKVQF